MTDVLGLFGYNRSTSSVNKLLAAYNDDVIDVDTGVGLGAGFTSQSKVEFATFLDFVFAVNGNQATSSFDGTTWSNTGVRNHCPIANLIRAFGTRVYLGDLKIASQTYRSKVWYCDLPYNNDVRWGLEYGNGLQQQQNSPIVRQSNALFKTYNIKVGDPLFILSGSNAGEYEVESVDSETQLTLTKNLLYSAYTPYIVGGNYFDVRTDDNDYLRGFGENSSRLLCFKLNSLHRYSGSSLLPVSGAVGTSSGRSIVNIKGFTLYFHGGEANETGIYLYDGTDSVMVSGPIQPYIDGIASSMFPNIVGWKEGTWYRIYVGDITNAQRDISVSKAVISFDVARNKYSIDPFIKTVKCATTFQESNVKKIFFGDDSGEVFQTPSGYSFDTNPIPWVMELSPQYPEGSEFLLNYTRVQVISRDARGVRVRYKLYNMPLDVDDTWQPLGEIQGDKTELWIPADHSRASGVNIRFEETGIRENTQYIEKVTIFYVPETTTIANI